MSCRLVHALMKAVSGGIQHSTAQHSTAQRSTAQRSAAHSSMQCRTGANATTLNRDTVRRSTHITPRWKTKVTTQLIQPALTYVISSNPKGLFMTHGGVQHLQACYLLPATIPPSHLKRSNSECQCGPSRLKDATAAAQGNLALSKTRLKI